MTAISRYLSICAMTATLLLAPMAVAQSNDSKSSATADPAASATKTKVVTSARSSGHANESLKVAGTAHDVVEYKDGEDGTMHTRPGNAKTTHSVAPAALPPTAPTALPSSDADATKHISNIKWQDRKAGIPALDAASKDAAKAPVSTLDGTSKDAAKSAVSPRDAQSGQSSGK